MTSVRKTRRKWERIARFHENQPGIWWIHPNSAYVRRMEQFLTALENSAAHRRYR